MSRKQSISKLGVLALCLLLPAPILAQETQSNDVRDELEELKRGQQEIQRQIQLMREVEALKQGQAEIRRELDAIKKLIQASPAAPARAAARAPSGSRVKDVVFTVGDNPSKRENTAKLTLVEFTDYQ